MRKILLAALLSVIAAGRGPLMADNQTFTPLEQQQISISTPGLFDKKKSFTIDFYTLGASDWSFPLPVGKSSMWPDYKLQISTKKGDNVKAMFAGVVRLSRRHPSYGNVVVVRHANGMETVYGHNAENLVDVGDKVKAGQTLAIVGSEGGQTYCQVEIMVDGRRINPEIIFDIHSHRLRRQELLFEKKNNIVDVSVIHAEVMPEEKEELANNEGWAFPLPGAKVISPYGARGGRRHTGIDIKTKPNDPIVAAFDGEVVRSGRFSGYGNCVIIKHTNGFQTLYSHNSKNLVKVGDKVKAGQKIALTGRTGRATTEHLHFETIVNGSKINPTLVFDFAKRILKKGVMKKYLGKK